jgi:hypothetical protein
MLRIRAECDCKRTTGGRDRSRVVPFLVACGLHIEFVRLAISLAKMATYPIVKVDSLPEWIVARVERATFGVELIREDKLELALAKPRVLGVSFLGCVGVDQGMVTGNLGNLKRSRSHRL